MTYWERFKNMFGQSVVSLARGLYVKRANERFRQRFGPDFPDINDLFRNTSLVFANADEFFEYARPISHKIVYIGGVTTSNPKALTGVSTTEVGVDSDSPQNILMRKN